MGCGTAMKTTSSTRAAGARPYCRAALLCLGFLAAVLGAYIAGVNSNDTRTRAALDPLCRAADENASLAGPADAALGSFCDRGGAGGNGGADGGAATLPREAVNGPVNAAPDRMNNTSTMIQDEAARAPLPGVHDVGRPPPPPLSAPGGLGGEGGGHDVPSEFVPASPQSVDAAPIGQYVSELGKAALDEEAKDDSEYAAEKAITGTRSSALLKIADERNRLLKIDDDRTAKEQGQRDVEETLPETKEKPAVSTKDHGEKKTRHEGNVKHQGQTIAKETARRIATKKKSVVMYLEEENIAKTERGVLAEIKNTIVGGQILGDAESSGSAVADHIKDAQGVESMDNRCATCAHGAAHGMCADSEGHHFLRSSGSGTALLQCVDTMRKGECENKRRGGVRV